MKSSLKVLGVTIHRYANPCANHCRYCSVGEKIFDDITFSEYENVVTRFLDWRAGQRPDIRIAPFILHTHATMSYEQSRRYRELCKAGDYSPLPLQMNGCPLMARDDLKRLMEDHYRAGYDVYSQTYSGMQVLHDRWVARRGEFAFFEVMAGVAADIGYTRKEQILLSKSGLADLAPLADHLDALEGKAIRTALPIHYNGWAMRCERERVTADDIRIIPQTVADRYDIAANMSDYLSERAWVQKALNGELNEDIHESFLFFRVHKGNLDSLLHTPCSQFIEDLENRYMSLHARIPEFDELALKYGDEDNERLYGVYEIRRKWANAFVNQSFSAQELSDYDISGF